MIVNKKLIWVAAVLVYAFCASAAIASDGVNTTLKASDVLEEYLKSISRIKSLQYSGILRGHVAQTPDGVERSHKRVFKGSCNCRYLELEHLDKSFEFDLNHSVTCYSPKALQVFHVLNRVMEESKSLTDPKLNPKLRYAKNDFFAIAIGWNPENDWGSDWNRALFQSPFAPLHDREQIPQTAEVVTIGAWDCHRICITSGTDRTDFFFCEKLGWMPVKIKQNISLTKNQKTLVVFDYSEFSETIAGIWLPQLISRKVFSSEGKEQSAFAELKLDQISVNSVEDSDWDISDLPNGTITIDFDSDEVTRLPGGQEMLADIVDFAKKEALSNVRSPRPYGFGVCVAAAFFSIIAIVFYTRFWRLP